ncbi:hypothetical protein SKAU_G00307760 [Synaphobranchus kaupii]|uniref:Uncharacterized protein n=1 Tax=Synaphobranchus kaupii TaxID=118154 RepID=A0A9Q1ER50_SYNKA|nr:hypothetical protein SKAU_G00307760 [Synaphobranchus kaupii]
MSTTCITKKSRGYPTGIVCFESVALSLEIGLRNTWAADGEPATQVWGWKWTLRFRSTRLSVFSEKRRGLTERAL